MPTLGCDISPERLIALEILAKRGGCKDLVEYVNNAFSHLEWMVGEVEGGSIIASIDPKKRIYTPLDFGPLNAIAAKAAPAL